MATSLTIHADRDDGELPPFWASIGFTPAKLLLGKVMQQTLGYVGAVPHDGIRHCRIHNLLNLVRGKSLTGATPVYDFSELDEGLDVLVRNGILPFFELMGNPAEAWGDFTSDDHVRAWRRLIEALARHLMDRYGAQVVEQWYFETWNEPDIDKTWAGKPVEAFCNYYDACSEGLLAANPKLRFGGPGTALPLSDCIQGLLAHCDTGRNYFTGETGVRLDFLSVHEKGVMWSLEDLEPNCKEVCRREVELVEYVRAHHPRLADRPLLNDECDPQVGWKDYHTWRGRPYFAAWICRSIILHEHIVRRGAEVDFALLSNDNGFLGGWGQRSQLARFPGKKTQAGEETFALVKKPVLTVMELLSLLGDRWVEVEGIADVNGPVGCIATRRGEQIAALVYHAIEKIDASGRETITLDLRGLPASATRLAQWRIDETHGNPYEAWAAMLTNQPTADQAAELRAIQEAPLLEEPRTVAHDGTLSVELDMPLQSVHLLVLTPDPAEPPAAVERVWSEAYRGLDGRPQTLVRWQTLRDRALRTYEVEAAETPEGPWQRVNPADLIAGAYLDEPPVGEDRCYRIRAIDLAGQAGEWSETLSVAGRS